MPCERTACLFHVLNLLIATACLTIFIVTVVHRNVSSGQRYLLVNLVFVQTTDSFGNIICRLLSNVLCVLLEVSTRGQTP